MEYLKKIEITLTPEEAENIIKEHLSKKYPDYEIKDVYFGVTTVYDGSYGDRGSEEMTYVNCNGVLK